MQSKGLKRVVFGAVGAAALLLAGAAQAQGVPGQGTWETTLKGRDVSGAAVAATSRHAVFLYDTVLDITWVRDANINGVQDWDTANTWANKLKIGRYGGWRLPTMIDTGSPGCDSSYSGGTDCGYNVQTRSGGITYSEMAHLWYVTLGNKSRCPPNSDCSVEQPGWGLTNTGDFQNVHAPFYWFGLENAANPTEAWLFVTNDGGQGPGDKTHPGGLDNGGKPFPSYALAVRPGDVCSTHNPKHC